MKNDLIQEMYLSKENFYFSLEREMFKNAIRENNKSILDIGCGTGALGLFLRTNQNCNVFGIEINNAAFQEAEKNLDGVIEGNVETIDIPYKNNEFDYIVMGDVLEHLINPMGTTKKLIKLLKPGGKILITVPNVRHWSILISLIFKGKWKYESSGLLDYTHLRFFTKKSLHEMLNDSGFKMVNSSNVIQKKSKSSFFNFFTLGLFSGFLASHTFIEIIKE
jgi:methionine biosynthesis protein MetW